MAKDPNTSLSGKEKATTVPASGGMYMMTKRIVGKDNPDAKYTEQGALVESDTPPRAATPGNTPNWPTTHWE